MIKLKTYYFIKSKPFLCVASLLQIIIKTELNIDFDQNEIGNYFGVYVPLDYSGKLSNIVRTSDKSKWGIIITKNEVNNFFKKNNLPLREQYLDISLYEDWSFEEEIKSLLNNNVNLICGFDYGYLLNNYKPSFIGHVALLLSISENCRDSFKIYDPGPKEPGVKTVKSIELYNAIRLKRNGIWKIMKVK